MNKIIIPIIFALLMATSAFATVSLDVSWQTSVDTLRPGGDTSIALVVSNTGTEHLTNVVVTPLGGPYVTATSGKIELGGIASLSSSQSSVSIRIDPNAQSTTSYLSLKVDYYTGTSSYSKTFKIPMTIRREPILQITNVKYNDTLAPGKTLLLSFDVRNAGLGPAKDLIVTLNNSDLFTVVESSGEILIDSLDSDKANTISFTIIIDPEADVGINSIPVSLKYYDETKSNSYTENKYISFTITGKIDFIVTTESAYGGTAKISITNRGTAPVEYLTVTATSGSTKKEYYIGSLDTDDTEVIDFPQSNGMGKYDIVIDLEYSDKFNNEYSEQKTLTVNKSFEFNPIIIIIIAAAAFMFWRYNKKKKLI